MHIHPSSPNSDRSLQSEESAAIKIQAGFRGYRVRKQLHSRPQERVSVNAYRAQNTTQRRQQEAMETDGVTANGVTSASAQLRDGGSRGPAEGGSLEDRCATKIQAGVRGFLVRKRQKMAADAATKIQAGFRGFKARKEAQKLRQK